MIQDADEFIITEDEAINCIIDYSYMVKHDRIIDVALYLILERIKAQDDLSSAAELNHIIHRMEMIFYGLKDFPKV
jgi:hypothetical protein